MKPASFGAIYFIGSMYFLLKCLLFANEKRTSPCWWSTSLIDMPVKRGRKYGALTRGAWSCFKSYPWPGNIRELQNVIERSVIVCDTEIFSVDESWLVRESCETQPASRPLSDKLVTQEKEMIEAALAESRGRVSGPSGAAAKLGIPPSTLESKIRSLKINKHRFKSA